MRVKKDKNSDHIIVVLSPINLPNTGHKRKKKTVLTRPLQESQIELFGKFMTTHDWAEVLTVNDVNTKVNNFHNTLLAKMNKKYQSILIG